MVCAPVSVIHHVSWMRLSNTCAPHLTTSGFNGSPTDNTWRSVDKSYSFTNASPAPISIRKAVGALYQMVTPKSSIALYQPSGEKRPPKMTVVTPLSQGENTPYAVPVNQPGSAVHQQISGSVKHKTPFPASVR